MVHCKYFVLEFIMNVDAARSSSVVSSDSETSSSSGESLDELHKNILQGGEALGAISLNLDEIVTMAVVNQLTSKTTKICLLTKTNLSFVWATLTSKTSYFIVYIDKLYFRVRQLCHSQ